MHSNLLRTGGAAWGMLYFGFPYSVICGTVNIEGGPAIIERTVPEGGAKWKLEIWSIVWKMTAAYVI